MTKTLQKEIVVFILLSMYQCSDTRVSRNRNFRKVRIAPPTIVPTPPTTVPPTGCWHNGVLHQPGSSFGGGYDAASNWCYGSYCDNDGNVINWDNFHCHPTTTPSTTTPPTTTTTTMPPQLGHHDGKFYPPNSEINSGEDRTNNWCFVLFCDGRGEIIDWDDFNCFGYVATLNVASTLNVSTNA